MESLYLLFLAVPILIVVFPLPINIKLYVDMTKNQGAFSIYIWKIKIIVAKAEIKGKDILLKTKRRNTEVDVEIGEEQLRFLNFFKDEVANKVKIREMNVYSVLGLSDPFKSSLFSAFVSNLILILLTKLKMWQPTASFNLNNKTDFYETHFSFALSGKVALSMFDILYSFIISILRSKQDRIFQEMLEN
ncbi:MAG: hypothetical protein MR423_02880 [Firmicutes bacterium]|nr:hypothetical protein [Bacillota bacterium]MDY3658988.1 hypothetical protein [Eubacteriales bacterium]